MSKAIVNIDGLIGTWEGEKGVGLTDVVSQVKQFQDFEEIEVHINSIGGVVQVGYDIYEYLRSLKKPITTITGNICASIGSVIFLAGDKRLMRPVSVLMIHNPWAKPEGDADTLQEFSMELRKIEKSLIDFYDKKTGIGKEALGALMRQETEMTADEAVKLGFATGLAEEQRVVAYFKIDDDMSKKNKTVREQLKSMLAKLSGDEAVDLTLQDGTGKEIVFETENETPAIGDKATVDEKPAEGEYTMPDGKIFVFEAGALKEIKEPEGGDDDEMKNAIRQIVKEELAAMKQESDEDLQLVVNTAEKLNKKFETLAKSVKSGYKPPKDQKKSQMSNQGKDDVYDKYRPTKQEEE